MNREQLKKKVRETAGALVSENGYVSAVDLLIKMNRLSQKNYEDWRHGRIPYLERVCEGNLSKLTVIMKELKKFAKDSKLNPSLKVYKKWGKGKKINLRFSKSGNQKIEESYSTNYYLPSKKKRLQKSDETKILEL
ncbi:MAG: hypothetical protein KAX49_07665 [Halanaerobiales bacterium]|nr:hypothetical protein [Halanaerobiales bacterium]